MLKHRICWESSTGKTGHGEWFDDDHVCHMIATVAIANIEHQNIDHWIETKDVPDKIQENNQAVDGPMPSTAEKILQGIIEGGGLLCGGKHCEVVHLINDAVLEAINEIRAMESRVQDLSTILVTEIKEREFYQQQAQAERGANAMMANDLKKTSETLAKERARVLRQAAMNAELIKTNHNILEKLMELAKISGFVVIID